MIEHERLEEALATLGAVLAERGRRVGVLVVGGSSLLLLGVVQRPTADIDVLGLTSARGYVKADGLPDFLAEAVRDVGDALGLGQGWFNAGPAGLVDFGLPDGLEDRITVRSYGALDVHVPAPEDLVCFKLYAAVDQGERSKHFSDLRALRPTEAQLRRAAAWARTQDISKPFEDELGRILRLLEVEGPHGAA